MLNSRRTGLLAAACALALSPGLAAAETLADAVALAYQSNPTLQQQRARLRALDENYVQSRQGHRPQADVQASATYSYSSAPQGFFGGGGGESNSGGAFLSATQPLYTGGRVTNAVRAAEADILAGREQLRQVEASVLLTVIQAYVDVRRDVQFLSIRTENLNVLTRQLEEARARFEVGEITRTDVAQSEARLAQSQAQLSSARAQLAISRSAYAAVVGQNPGDLEPEPPLNSLPTSVDTAFAVAEDISPAIRAAAFTEQASRLRVSAAKADLGPTVALQARLGYEGGTVDPLRDYDRTLTASAVVTQPLYAGGVRRSRIRQATEQNTADLIAVEGSRRDVLQDVAQAWNQLEAARSNILSNEEQVRANRIAAEGVREEAAVGLRTTIEVLNAEQELRNAELLLVQARRDNYLAGASLLGAMGRLEAANLLPGIPTYEPDASFRRIKRAGSMPWETVVERLDELGAPSPPSRKPVLEPVDLDAPVATN